MIPGKREALLQLQKVAEQNIEAGDWIKVDDSFDAVYLVASANQSERVSKEILNKNPQLRLPNQKKTN